MLKKKKAKKLSEYDKEELFWSIYFFHDVAEDNFEYSYRDVKIKLKLIELGLLKEFNEFYEEQKKVDRNHESEMQSLLEEEVVTK
ncbi:MAG: hypothetical protein ACFFDN_00050 [Candidatus Hodarchaeota archaeon]